MKEVIGAPLRLASKQPDDAYDMVNIKTVTVQMEDKISMKTFFQANKKRIIVLVAVAGIFALAASWTLAKSYNAAPLLRSMDADGTKWSKAVLAVSNLSCGGCIDTIRKSVATLPGTGEVMVDLASATAEVLFDGNRVKDPQIIAQVITDGGYPARIQRILAPAQLNQVLAQAEEKARTFIATVGRIDVPRKDFEIESVTLDEFFRDKPLPTAIKMDIEGAELLALLGMEKIIESSKNLKIFTEFYPALIDRAGFSVEDFAQKLLNEWHFSVEVLDDYTKNQRNWKVESISDFVNLAKKREVSNLFLEKR